MLVQSSAGRKAPLDAHEKQAEIVVLVLVGMQNIGAVLVEQARHPRHQPLAVGTMDQQNRCIFHPLQIKPSRGGDLPLPVCYSCRGEAATNRLQVLASLRVGH